jgi:hypothetical protein
MYLVDVYYLLCNLAALFYRHILLVSFPITVIHQLAVRIVMC